MQDVPKLYIISMKSYASPLSGNINCTTITISYQILLFSVYMDKWTFRSLSGDYAPFNCLGFKGFCLYE